MVTFEEARQIALDCIGPERVLIDELTMEKPFGWYFGAQSRKYVETGDFRYRLIGSNGFIVDRETGRDFHFGSAFSLERDFAAYESGFKYKSYDLTIKSVRNWWRTVCLLHRLGMTYVVPEWENGVEWKIPRPLTKRQIFSALRSLPHSFVDRKFYFVVEVFWEIDKCRCCTYELSEHRASAPTDSAQT